MEVINSLYLTIHALIIILNSLGLVALYRHKKRTNQNLLLGALSCFELLTGINGVPRRLEKVGVLPKVLFEYNEIIGRICWYQIFCAMYAITIDRLVCILNPLKYKILVTRRAMKCVVSGIFVFSTMVPIIIAQHLSLRPYMRYVGIVFSSFYIVLNVVTYTIVITMSIKPSSYIRRNSQRAYIKKQFFVSGMIILSFFFFNTVAASIYYISRSASNSTNAVTEDIAGLFMLIGFVADPLIYIFLTKHYREALFRIFKVKFFRHDTSITISETV